MGLLRETVTYAAKRVVAYTLSEWFASGGTPTEARFDAIWIIYRG